MRLIDTDELLELYEGFEDMGLKVPVEVVVQSIKDMPTAYDIDKVVEQLEEASHWTEPHYDEDGYSCDDEYEVITLNTAIEIVKKGGNV